METTQQPRPVTLNLTVGQASVLRAAIGSAIVPTRDIPYLAGLDADLASQLSASIETGMVGA